MNESGSLSHLYAAEMIRRRHEDTARLIRSGLRDRRTARRSLARGLHRLADRLDG